MKQNLKSLYDLGYEVREGIDGIDIWNVKTNKIDFHLKEEELFQNATPLKIWQLVYDKINAIRQSKYT